MSVSHSGAIEPPPIDAKHIESARVARAYIERAKQSNFDKAPSMVMLADLLDAYDAVCARVAWIVASHAEAMHEVGVRDAVGDSDV